MTTEDRNKLVTTLREGRATWLDSLKGAANITQRPEPGRWSVLEIAEHVAIVEKRLASVVRNAPNSGDAPAKDEAREDAFTTLVAGRTDRFAAPEFVQPTGTMNSLEEAIAAFETARADIVQFVETNPDLRSTTTKHSRFGVLSGYEMALILAAHPVRHARQVAEARAAVNG